MRYFFSIALVGILISCAEKESTELRKPNFLFLFADDLTYDAIAALGNDEIQTPNLDALVSEGFTFTHAFNQGSWSGAVCVVSRAMLACGRYVYHARNDINTVPLWGQVMGQAGYQTFLTGKWHNGSATALKSFQTAKSVGAGMYETKGGVGGPGYYRPAEDELQDSELTTGFWSASDTSLLGHWAPHFYDIVQTDSGATMTEKYVMHRHTSEIYADNAIEFIKNHQTNDQDPFFMYVAFNAPHDPRQSPQKYLDMYPLDKVSLPGNYLPEHPFDQGEKTTLRDEILAPIPRSPYAVKTHIREYYAIITHLDEQIGRVIASLKESGQYENTYIIFTADHGLAVGKHGLLGKQNQYDHSIRVPFIICGPNIPKAQKSDALVYLQSIFPTTCQLAGINVPPTVEFSTLMPLISDQDKGEEAIFGSYKDFQRTIRTSQHKLILYPQVNEAQLFDLVADPLEMHNVIQNKDNEELASTLYSRLMLLQEEVGDTLQLKGLDHFSAN